MLAKLKKIPCASAMRPLAHTFYTHPSEYWWEDDAGLPRWASMTAWLRHEPGFQTPTLSSLIWTMFIWSLVGSMHVRRSILLLNAFESIVGST